MSEEELRKELYSLERAYRVCKLKVVCRTAITCVALLTVGTIIVIAKLYGWF